MAKKISPLLPSTAELLLQFGDRLRLARLRRRLSAKQVAERAGMSPMTLRSLERGGDGVTMGAYLAVMQILGIEKDLDLLGQADPLGRDLQDARMSRQSAPSHKVSARPPATTYPGADELSQSGVAPQLHEPTQNYEGFVSSRTLADLISLAADAPLKKDA